MYVAPFSVNLVPETLTNEYGAGGVVTTAKAGDIAKAQVGSRAVNFILNEEMGTTSYSTTCLLFYRVQLFECRVEQDENYCYRTNLAKDTAKRSAEMSILGTVELLIPHYMDT